MLGLSKVLELVLKSAYLTTGCDEVKFAAICMSAGKYCDYMMQFFELALKPYSRAMLFELRKQTDQVLKDIESVQYEAGYFLETRKRTIDFVEEVIGKLRTAERAGNVTAVAAGTGGLIAAAGAVLAPVSGGLSAGIAAASFGLGAASAAASLGAQGLKILFEKECVKNAKTSLDLELQISTALRYKFAKIQQLFVEIQNLLSDLEKNMDFIQGKHTPDTRAKTLHRPAKFQMAKMVGHWIISFETFTGAGKGVTKSGATTAGAAASKTVGYHLLALGVVVDLYSIIEASAKLHNGSPSAVADDIEEQVLKPLQLDEEKLVVFFEEFAENR